MARYKKQRKAASNNKRKVFLKEVITDQMNQSYLETLARMGIQQKIQEALETERDEIVGRSWYDHRSENDPIQYRNGYGKERKFYCGCKHILLRKPRTREPYESAIIGKYERMSPELKQLIPELYLHGLSTGDFEPALGWMIGEDAPLSPNSILRLKAKWEQEYEQWKSEKLEEEYLYVWVDGIYPKGGPIDESLAVLVVVGVNRKGEKKLLAIEEGYGESEESWGDVLRSLKRRGVRWIGLAIGDGNLGVWKALQKVFSRTRQQRCWVHKMRNILDKVPKKAHEDVLESLRSIYKAGSYDEAQKLKQEFINRYHRLYPKAVASLVEAGESLFTYFQFPKKHWKSLRTTNPIESIFSTVRLRTKAARRLRTRIATVSLVFQLLRHCERRLNRLPSAYLIPEIIDSLKNKNNNSKFRYAA